jgi:hypothetical protein
VLEVVFILLEPLSRSRRIFIGSHSLPLSGSPYRSFTPQAPSNALRIHWVEDTWKMGANRLKVGSADPGPALFVKASLIFAESFL